MYRKPLLLLLGLAIFIPELMSGATPVLKLELPFSWVLFLFAYGIPVLLIRELAVRHKVGIFGTVVFGLAYGIVNEGPFAKTLVRSIHLPIDKYDHYGYALGISFPWMAAICTWHAFAAVLFPIALVHYLYPEASDKPWLKLPTSFVLLAADFAVGCLLYFKLKIPDTISDPGVLALLLLLMAVLFVIGLKVPGSPIQIAGHRTIAPLLCGVSMFIPFLVLIILAAGKIPVPLFYLALIVMVALYRRIMMKREWHKSPALICIGIGFYASYAIFSMIGLVGNPLLLVISAAVDWGVLAIIWKCLKPRNTLSTTPHNAF